MKLRNVVLGAGVVVVVALAAGVYFLLTSLDVIVERAIEHYGSEITGTAVRVASVDISLSSGRGTVRGSPSPTRRDSRPIPPSDWRRSPCRSTSVR